MLLHKFCSSTQLIPNLPSTPNLRLKKLTTTRLYQQDTPCTDPFNGSPFPSSKHGTKDFKDGATVGNPCSSISTACPQVPSRAQYLPVVPRQEPGQCRPPHPPCTLSTAPTCCHRPPPPQTSVSTLNTPSSPECLYSFLMIQHKCHHHPPIKTTHSTKPHLRMIIAKSHNCIYIPFLQFSQMVIM